MIAERRCETHMIGGMLVKALRFLDKHLEEIILSVLIVIITFNTCLQCFMLLLLLLIIGCVFDGIPAIIIFTPLLLPITEAAGINITHFGVIMTVALAIGQVTPPMGVNLFVGSRIGEIPVLTLAKKCVPLLLAFLFATIVIVFVPQLSLCLI